MSAGSEPLSPTQEARRRVADAFPLERAFTHAAATITSLRPLSFLTPPGRWQYGVSLPAAWPPSASWIHERDGSIRVRFRLIDGCVSVLALSSAGDVIDEVIVDSTTTPVDVELASAPLGTCHEVVVRNARSDEAPSRVEIVGVECVDLGPVQPSGDELGAPADLRLRPIDDWARYYGWGRSFVERVRSARYAALDRVKWMPWLEDLSVQIYPNDDLSRALHLSGLYEPSTMLVLQRVLGPGGVFMDVGANAGLFSMLASRWVGPDGRVFAFEPSEREIGRLLDHLTRNGLKNVTAVRQAVGNLDGSALLRVAPFPNAGLNTLGASFAYPGISTERIETVNTTTLDRFVEKERLERVDAIKMDIEGGEHAALSGCVEVLRRFRPVLILEVSRAALAGCGTTPAQVVELLTAARYKVCRIGSVAELIPLVPGEVAPEGNVVALPVERISVESSGIT
jgi:FkbM family methyltransferase